MSPWRWFLLRTFCLLPVSSGPPRSAPASGNCELNPPNKARGRRGRCSHLAPPGGWGGYLPSSPSSALSDPEPTWQARLPPASAVPPSSHFSPRPRFLFPVGAQPSGNPRLSPPAPPSVNRRESRARSPESRQPASLEFGARTCEDPVGPELGLIYFEVCSARSSVAFHFCSYGNGNKPAAVA